MGSIIDCILIYSHGVYHDENKENAYTDEVKGFKGDFTAEQCVCTGKFGEGLYCGKERIDDDCYESELRRAQFGISKLEFLFKMRVDTYINCEHQIEREYEHRKAEVHKTGEAYSSEYQDLADAIDRMIYVVAIDGPLLMSDSCKSAVE